MGRAQVRRGRWMLLRAGLLIIVGSAFASVLLFYIDVGKSVADMSGEGISTERKDLAKHFTEKFLFAGSVAGVMFWVGAAVSAVGVVIGFRK